MFVHETKVSHRMLHQISEVKVDHSFCQYCQVGPPEQDQENLKKVT